MKIYRVVTKRDGETTKKPRQSSTKTVQSDYRYAADSMQEVWYAIDWITNDPEIYFVAIIEEHQAVAVLEA